MTPKVIMIRAYQVSVLNLIPGLAYTIAGDDTRIPAIWKSQDGFAYLAQEGPNDNGDQCCDTVAKMVDLEGVELPKLDDLRNGFRYIPWSKNSSVLKNIASQDKFQILSTSVDSEVDFVKDFLKDDVVTVGVHYDEDDHIELVRSIARFHIYSLHNGWMTNNDPTILSEEEYMEKFSDFVTESTKTSYDYNIHFKDFTNKTLMMDLFKNIGLPFNEKGEQFYDRWLSDY